MRQVLIYATLLVLVGCGSRGRYRTEVCEAPVGSVQADYLMFVTGNLELSHGFELTPGCHAQGTGGDLVLEGCGVDDLTDWKILNYHSENGRARVNGVMRSETSLHVMMSQSVGGMPSGALTVDRFTVVIPPTDLPIVECTTTHYAPRYKGPMPA